MRDGRILQASIDVILERGLAGWTVDTVASRAECAKGLVLYHHQSKRQLLEATAEAIGARVSRERLEAAQDGNAVERLWATVDQDVRTGAFAARISLAAIGIAPPLPGGLRDRLATSLGIDPSVLEDEKAIEAVLDGLSLQLLIGTSPKRVRDCYDRLWLGLIAP